MNRIIKSHKFIQGIMKLPNLIMSLMVILMFSKISNAQTFSWYQLPNSPYRSSGFQDLNFIDDKTGWLTHVYGNLYRTTDGGNNWTKLDSVYLGTFWQAAFINENTGWVASMNLSYVLMKTTNGGFNLFKDPNLPSPEPPGISSIHSIGQNFIYGCGRYDDSHPPFFIKSTNGGSNWIVTQMSQYAKYLTSAYFFDQNTGFLTGAIGEQPEFRGSIILKTSDGGASWSTVYLGGRNREEAVKICFVDGQNGFVSLTRYGGYSKFFAKTSDGGNVWTTLPFVDYSEIGIGFINPNTGWIGGNFNPTYGTTNGGVNWFNANIGLHIHDFEFFADTLGYACGLYVYKYSRTSGITQLNSELSDNFKLYQNYPNPFNPNTKINYSLVKTSDVILKVFDNLGKEVSILVNQRQNPGTYEVDFLAYNLSSGIYYYKMESGDFSDVKKMILLR